MTLCDGDDWRDHRRLLSAGLDLYEKVTLCESGEMESTVHVCGGKKVSVRTSCKDGIAVTLPKSHGKITSSVSLPPFVYAGFEAGKELGFVTFYLDGEPIGKVGLAADEGCAIKQRKKNIFGK